MVEVLWQGKNAEVTWEPYEQVKTDIGKMLQRFENEKEKEKKKREESKRKRSDEDQETPPETPVNSQVVKRGRGRPKKK